MSGGDLLFYFTFFILPTVLIVSSIWTYVLLKKGVLLPPHPTRTATAQRRQRATDAAVTSDEFEESDDVVTDEDVGIAASATPEEAVITDIDAEDDSIHPAAEDADLVVAADNDTHDSIPLSEQTLEMDAVDAESDTRSAALSDSTAPVGDQKDERSTAVVPLDADGVIVDVELPAGDNLVIEEGTHPLGGVSVVVEPVGGALLDDETLDADPAIPPGSGSEPEPVAAEETNTVAHATTDELHDDVVVEDPIFDHSESDRIQDTPATTVEAPIAADDQNTAGRPARQSSARRKNPRRRLSQIRQADDGQPRVPPIGAGLRRNARRPDSPPQDERLVERGDGSTDLTSGDNE